MKKNKLLYIMGSMIFSAAFVILTIGNIGGCSDATEKESISSESGEIIRDNKELENFNKIKVNVDSGNVEIVKGDKYAIEAEYDSKTDKLTYEVNSNKLVVNGKSENKGFKLFDFGAHKSMEIKIYVPDDKLDDLNMDMGSGDSKIESISGDNLKIDCESGNVEIDNAAYNKIDFKAESGNFNADKLRCNDMQLKSSSGNISCSSLKTKMLSIKASSANVDLDGELKGKNTIETSSGNIDINTSVSKKDYSYDIGCSSGEIKIDGENMKDEYKKSSIGTSNSFDINCSSGDINIKF